MKQKVRSPYVGNGSLTREQFLFHEMRTTAALVDEGLEREEIIHKICEENLFQYPTEKSLRGMARVCLERLEALGSPVLVHEIAAGSSGAAKQICLYAMMKDYRLVWDFMVTVIGAKYRSMDMSFGRIDLNTFFIRLAEQDDVIASWGAATVQKIKSVLVRILVENGYLDSFRATHLNPVLISPVLETAIRKEGRTEALPAFNCLGR